MVTYKVKIAYNILNKRAVGQCTLDRRKNKFTENSTLSYQDEGAIFLHKSNNKSYDCTKHNYKSK